MVNNAIFFFQNKNRLLHPFFVIHQSFKSLGPTLSAIESICFTCIVLIVTYSDLLWGTCSPSSTLELEYMHACAAKIIHRLPRDTQNVLSLTIWDSYLNIYETR